MQVAISLPAESLPQAITSGVAVLEQHASAVAAVRSAMPSDEHDRRLDPIPELMSVTEAAAELGQAR